MEAEKILSITKGLRSLSSHLKKRQRSGDNYIQLNQGSANKLKNLKPAIRGKFANDTVKNETASKSVLIDQLRDEIYESEKIRNLGTLRDKLVFSSGVPESDIMFIGEAPGYEEEVKGMPFVGPSGQLLTKIIKAMGLNRENVYISNIVKFRPAIDSQDQGTSNRKPSHEEMRVSLPFMLNEIEVIKPKVMVALGATAMQGLLNINAPLASARGKIHLAHGCKAVVTYHPSYLLRSKSPNRDKRKLWEDMLMVMKILGLNISEKQKNYFK